MPKPVLPLNQTVEISEDEAATLWYQGVERPLLSWKIKVSECGKWAIKKAQISHYIHSSERLGKTALWLSDVAQTELNSLRSSGMNVISHAIVPSHMDTIYTVSPYIPNLHPVEPSIFKSVISPVLLEYLSERLSGPIPEWYLEDIYRPSQYSAFKPNSVGFLHDVEPYCTQIQPIDHSPAMNLLQSH